MSVIKELASSDLAGDFLSLIFCFITFNDFSHDLSVAFVCHLPANSPQNNKDNKHSLGIS